MLTKAGIVAYQFKLIESMATMQRSLSQTSLESFTLQHADASFETVESTRLLTQNNKLATSMEAAQSRKEVTP